MIQIRILVAILFAGVGVVENPLIVRVGHIGIVSVLGHDAFADNFDFVGLVSEHIESVSLSLWLGPGTDVLVVTPDEVRRVTGWIENVSFAAIHADSKHTRGKATGWFGIWTVASRASNP